MTPPTAPGTAAGAETAAPLGPVGERQRIIALDVLRGAALLGIFFVNMQLFAMPFMKMIGYESLTGGSLDDQLAWGFIKAFCEFKFISLFSLLFGAGLVVQMTRAEAAGRKLVPIYLRRMAVLAVLGLVHGLLLWYGDILFMYAVLGTLLLLLRRLTPRITLIAGASTLVLAICVAMAMVGLQLAMGDVELPTAESWSEANEGADPPSGWGGIVAAQGNPASELWMEAERRAYREGPFADAFAFRAATYGYAVLGGILGYGWRVLGMFLLGAALMKLRFFEPSQRRWQVRLAVIGLAVGVPLELTAVGVIMAADFQFSPATILSSACHEIGSIVLCLGYTGALTLAANAAGRWLAPLAAAGRMALTVYLMETIVTTSLMYWWGLRWFGEVSRPQQLLLVCAIYAVLTAAAWLWLRVFIMGPFEWVWRTLTYASPPRLLRRRET